jgi:hypothetical protein
MMFVVQANSAVRLRLRRMDEKGEPELLQAPPENGCAITRS